ncbi:MAG: hypothetical protein PHV82_09155 [Victivallaceae bacterium]|nr:hypothetical protein [Victivallaceae bacterium]
MQRSYQLFSDEVKKGDQQQLYFTFLANVQKVFKNIRLYSQTHKLVATAVSDLINSCTPLFEYHQCLVVVKIGDKLITPKIQIDIDDAQIADLAKILEIHHIRKFRFWQGVSDNDIIELCKILAMKPLPLLKAGGIKFLLSQANISRIEIDLASHTDVSGEEGTAGLIEFMGSGAGSRKNWLTGLKKAGIDEKPFIDYLLYRATKNTMMQRELQLAVQVFNDPRAVAELLVFLSADPEDPEAISAETMFAVMQRLENVILMHSAQESEDIRRQLGKAARLLDPALRLELLEYYCRATLKDKIIPSVKLFSFDLPEYFEAIMKEYHSQGTLSYASCLRPTREKLNELVEYFRQRLENGASSEEFLEQLARAAELNFTVLPVSQPPTGSKADPELLNRRIANLQSDLELGYLHVLTHFLVIEKDEERILDICTRLAGLLELYLRKRDYATLIPVFKQFTRLDSSSVKIFNKVFWEKLKPGQLSVISDLFLDCCRQDQEPAVELLLALDKYLPKEFIPAFTSEAIRQKLFMSYRVISQLLRSEEAVNRFYDELLESEDIDDRLTAFDFMAMSHNREAERILLDNLEDKKTRPACRLGIISLLAAFSGEASASLLTRIAAGSVRCGLSAYLYRCAAVEALSIRKEEEAIPVLESIIARRNLWRRNYKYELRFGAAYALSGSPAPAAAKALETHMDKLQRTFLSCAADRIKAAVKKYLLLAKRIITAVIRPFIYLFTVILNTVKAAIRIIKYAWNTLCRLLMLIPRTFIRIIKWVVVKIWAAAKCSLVFTGNILLKIPLVRRLFASDSDKTSKDGQEHGL